MKRISFVSSLALVILLVMGCTPATATRTTPDSQEPSDSAPATPDEPQTQGVTSRWRLNAYNPATDTTLSFLIVFENVEGGLAGNAYAFDETASDIPSEALGTVTGRVSSREQLDFRISFAEGLGGGYWDVSARLNNSAFAGNYTASDDSAGSVIGSNLDGG